MSSRLLIKCAADILAPRPRLVGFTSVFQQHLASLGARETAKARAAGHASCSAARTAKATMGAETVRQFPFVDAAVSGEGTDRLPGDRRSASFTAIARRGLEA